MTGTLPTPYEADRQKEQFSSALAHVLTSGGLTFPLGGYYRGDYIQTCHTCEKRHRARLKGTSCLPCAVVEAVKASKKSAVAS